MGFELRKLTKQRIKIMKKSLLFLFAVASVFTACDSAKKGDAVAVESNAAEVQVVECVASGDVVYIDLDYIMSASQLYASEGKALEAKVDEFQKKMLATQESLAKKEQSLAAEYNKLQGDAAKLEQDYAKGLITTLNAQQKQAELQKKGESIQTRMTALQNSMQKEGEALQKEEQALTEEQMVLMNRFQDFTRRAVDEINADGRYKMILNAVSVVDADPTLNISDLVLKAIDQLYAAETAAK